MLKAYFDESGIHEGAKACVVAGYWGKVGPWRRLDSNWRSTLKKFGVSLEQFRAKEVLNRNGLFHRWDDEKHGEFLARIGAVVRDTKIHPVCYGVFTEDFFSLSLPERRFLTGASWHAERQKFLSTGSPSKPYFVAFTECLKIVASYTPAVGRVNFFFGIDRPAAEYAGALFRYLKKRTRLTRLAKVQVDSRFSTEKFGGIYFPLAKETPSLQVADLLAYLSYTHMLERRANGDWESPPGDLLLALLGNRKQPDDTTYRNAQLMRDVISVVPNLPKE
jgi:hypothetical protein